MSDATHMRKSAIIVAAQGVIATYGFKRTSMEDIAHAAGVSRPALYQSFANKKDIYRAIIRSHIDEIQARLDLGFEETLPLHERLGAIFDIAVLEPHRLLEGMPHGEEVLGLKDEYASDLFLDFRNYLRNAVQTQLTGAGKIDQQRADDLSTVIDLAIYGLKSERRTVREMEGEIQRLLRVVVPMASSMGGAAV